MVSSIATIEQAAKAAAEKEQLRLDELKVIEEEKARIRAIALKKI